MKAYFDDLAAYLDTRLQPSEEYKCWLAAEASDFVRFNHGVIRQPGHVRQLYLTLNLINGRRHAKSSVCLGGDAAIDRSLLDHTLAVLREQIADLPEDPHLMSATEVNCSERIVGSRLPPTSQIVDEVLRAAQGYDLVGLLAAGPVYRGFANSYGQRNWHEASSFNLDWSLCHSRDKAVKTTFAGFDWSNAEFRAKFERASEQLAMLGREPVNIKPGPYRAYLTPTALNEMLGMLNWGGLAEKSFRTMHSSLRRMRDEGLRLNPAVTLIENTAQGLSPAFQADGYIKPDRVMLLDQGRLAGSMISPRTSKEYGIATNGADDSEAMSALDLAAGELPLSRVLEELDTGVFVGNLWYLNYSDRANCKITGMTRFATFWVEHGQIKAPLNVMRFDDSLFRVLGENLLALTRERELLVDAETYGARSTGSARLPGALVKDLMFVL
jgi:predicted Zn-dependent protease